MGGSHAEKGVGTGTHRAAGVDVSRDSGGICHPAWWMWSLAAGEAAPMRPEYLGLTLIVVWNQIVLYAQRVQVDDGANTVAIGFIRSATILVLMAVVALRRRDTRLPRWWEAASVALMTLSTVLYLLDKGFGMTWLEPLAALACGVGLTWGGGMWMTFYLRLPMGAALFLAIASMGLSSVIGLFVSLLPQEICYCVGIALPMASYVCYRRSLRAVPLPPGPPGHPWQVDAAYDAEPRSTFVRILAGIALFSFALGVTRGFPAGVSIELPLYLRVLQHVFVIAVMGGVLWLTFVRGVRPRVSYAWITLISLMLLGMALLAVGSEPARDWGATLILVVNMTQVALLWLLVYDTSRHSSVPMGIVFGAYWLCHVLFRESGRGAILLAGPYVSGWQVLLAASLVLIVSVVMGLLLTDSLPRTRTFFCDFPRVGARQEPGGAAGGRAPDADGAALGGGGAVTASERASTDAAALADWLRERHGLTNRECDVAELLAQGRSSTYIAHALTLSPDTVRGYTKSIYSKLDVHSKQELIDVIRARASATVDGRNVDC